MWKKTSIEKPNHLDTVLGKLYDGNIVVVTYNKLLGFALDIGGIDTTSDDDTTHLICGLTSPVVEWHDIP